MNSRKKRVDNRQGDLHSATVIDFTKEATRRSGKADDVCCYRFTDLVVPTLHCQHEHRIILVDPSRDMETIVNLIRRGELELTEAERYAQMPLLEAT